MRRCRWGSRGCRRWAKWRAIERNSRKRFVADRCNVSAWSLACKGFLAIFPAVIALLGLVQLLHLGTSAAQKLTASIDKKLPPGASGVVSQAVSAASHESASESVIALIGGILIALSSVAGGVSTLQIALDVAYEVPHDPRFMARRIRSLPLMLATVVLGLIASALSVFGGSVGDSIQSHFPLGGAVFTILWTVVRWLATIATITVLLQICYSYGLNRKKAGWRWTSAGSAIGAAIFLLASLGFSLYVRDFASYGKIYGAFAGTVILIIWLYLGGLAVLLGAEVNAQAEREAAA
jgi:membrane protein